MTSAETDSPFNTSSPSTSATTTASPSSYAAFGFDDPNSFTNGFIREKAVKLSQCDGFRHSDIEDIEQTLKTHLWSKISDYHADRGAPTTFVKCVVANESVSLIRRYQAEKRGAGVVHRSLEEPVQDTECQAVPFIETLCTQWTGVVAATGTDGESLRTDAALDIQGAIASLPTELQDLAMALQTAPSKAKARRKLRLSQRKFDARVEQLRQRFEDLGLSAYTSRFVM